MGLLNNVWTLMLQWNHSLFEHSGC